VGDRLEGGPMERSSQEKEPKVWHKFEEEELVVPPSGVSTRSDPNRFARYVVLSRFLKRYKSYLTNTPIKFFHQGKWQDRHWVVGPYLELKRLATDMRAVEEVQQQDFSLACFGRRNTDLPPTGSQPDGGFRKIVEQALTKRWEEMENNRKAGLPVDVWINTWIHKRKINPNTNERRSDLEEYAKFKEFYSKKTLEAHHIVEKSILGKLELNDGELANAVAPCVLVVAELHQQMYTREVSKKRDLFYPGMSSEKQTKTLTEIYEGTKVEKGLYDTYHMGDLLEIAKIIIKEAEDYAEHIKHR
jgi:hypothetical protein